KKAKKVSGIAVAVLGILLLSSCGVQKETELTHRKVPAHYLGKNQTDTLANDSTSMATISWRTFFQDEYLLRLIDTALANNPDMQQALYRVEMARANMRLRKNALFPSIDAVAEAGLRKYGFYTMDGIGNYDTNFSNNLKDDEQVPDPVPDYFLGLRASW